MMVNQPYAVKRGNNGMTQEAVNIQESGESRKRLLLTRVSVDELLRGEQRRGGGGVEGSISLSLTSP